MGGSAKHHKHKKHRKHKKHKHKKHKKRRSDSPDAPRSGLGMMLSAAPSSYLAEPASDKKLKLSPKLRPMVALWAETFEVGTPTPDAASRARRDTILRRRATMPAS